ncbi:adenylyl-sulfate kinase [Limisalsivibrio acetivorans]|uniref:adenylyl-sulfate kinase n=1 Tax=Limisalsivibrio acetivorans TaxID=1304888 RepID=UPI0003B3E108|nr:adenylyl-sulfate kinase [Limisalsivibrio acetivorans]
METKKRSLIKAFSWRITATLVTATIVYIIFGRFELALLAGGLESVSKIFLYFFHERIWSRIGFGIKKVQPFVVLLTGLPCAGKTVIGDRVAELMAERGVTVKRFDSKDVRSLFPQEGFSREERLRYLKRVGLLLSMFERDGRGVVASFVSPYKEGRAEIERLCGSYEEVFIKAGVDACEARDAAGKYAKARRGEIENFTGVSDAYEEPENPALIIDTEKNSIDESAGVIADYLCSKYVK